MKNTALVLQDIGFQSGALVQRQADALRKTNDVTEEYGLTLSDDDIRQLLVTRRESLSDSARIEFGDGIAARLVLAFADSPYLTQENYARTIAALLVLFDTFKNELRDVYNDRELLTFMRNAFDGECAGSLEILETEVFPRLLTADLSVGYRTAQDAQFAENDRKRSSLWRVFYCGSCSCCVYYQCTLCWIPAAVSLLF